VIEKMDEKKAYIDFISNMLDRCDLRKIKIVYEFVLRIV